MLPRQKPLRQSPLGLHRPSRHRFSHHRPTARSAARLVLLLVLFLSWLGAPALLAQEPAPPAQQPPPAEVPPAAQAPPAGGVGAAPQEPDPADTEITPIPAGKGKRVDIAEGDIKVLEFLRFLADYTGHPVIVDSTQKQLLEAMITIAAKIPNADGHVVSAILDANRFLVTTEILPSGRQIIRVDSAQQPAPPQGDPKENPVIMFRSDGTPQVFEDQPPPPGFDLKPDEIATLVFTLKYTQPADAITSLNALISGAKGATARSKAFGMVDVKNSMMVIITAKFGLLNYLKKLLTIIDVPIQEPERIVQIIEVENADAEELAGTIEQFLQGRTGGGFGRTGFRRTSTQLPTAAPTPGVVPQPGTAGGRSEIPGYETTLLPDYRTQKIIVETYTERDLEDINMLVRELDVRFDYRRLRTHIYQVRYLKADEVAQDIQVLIGGGGGGLSGRAGLGTRTSGTSRQRGVGRVGATRGAVAPPTATAPGAGGAPGAPGTIPALIVPHIQTNSLLIQAEPEEYAEILNILGQIDVKRRQVFLEAALVQVSSSSSLNYTIELLAGDPDDRSTRALFETSFGLSGLDFTEFNRAIPDSLTADQVPPGAFLAIMNRGKFPALITFFKTNSDTEVLATPFILADDNETNIIEILETQFVQLTNTVNTVTTTSQEAEDAGITLEITPTISSRNAVFLELGLTVSAFQGEAATAQVLPPKIENIVTSAVTIPDGEIFVIGGLTREQRSKSVSKVPIIGDIPILGKLFRSEATSKDVSNLYVFLRAHVLTHPEFHDGYDLTEQGVQKVKAFAPELRITNFEPPDVAFPPAPPPDYDSPSRIHLQPDAGGEEDPRGPYDLRGVRESYDGDRENPYLHPETGDAPRSTFPVPRRTAAGPPAEPRAEGAEPPPLEPRAEAPPPEPRAEAAEPPPSEPRAETPSSPSAEAGPAASPANPRTMETQGLEVDPTRRSWIIPLRPRTEALKDRAESARRPRHLAESARRPSIVPSRESWLGIAPELK